MHVYRRGLSLLLKLETDSVQDFGIVAEATAHARGTSSSPLSPTPSIEPLDSCLCQAAVRLLRGDHANDLKFNLRHDALLYLGRESKRLRRRLLGEHNHICSICPSTACMSLLARKHARTQARSPRLLPIVYSSMHARKGCTSRRALTCVSAFLDMCVCVLSCIAIAGMEPCTDVDDCERLNTGHT